MNSIPDPDLAQRRKGAKPRLDITSAGVRWWSVLGGLFLALASLHAAPVEQLIRTNQPGRMVTKEFGVEYIAAGRTPVVAPTNQWLSFSDALRTLEVGRATVRLRDYKHVYLRDRSKLEIVPDSETTNSPTLRLLEGELYLSRGGGEVELPVEAAGTRGVPKGTEFLVSVAGGVATFTMFDGEVELTNLATPQPVRITNGWQGIAAAGQPIQMRPILEAQNIVQWWLYYPAVLDPVELELTPAERTQLAPSLARYRTGHLKDALQLHPSFPNGPLPSSDSGKAYLAALNLSAGAVERAGQLLGAIANRNGALPQALELMNFAVTNGGAAATYAASNRTTPAYSASFLIAQSYAHQSTNNLHAARAAAHTATEQSPEFGFAWARLAELEFAFGHTRAAREAVDRALELSPENAQAHCVRGFLLAASYRFDDALAAFDRAVELDSFLGNAWLGRGLVKRRMDSLGPIVNRKSEIINESWLSDLQAAAIVEPRRSLVRAYAGKAFSDAGRPDLALKELDYAAQLDPNDPTPPLYKALELHQQNRPNEAVRELERSIALNDNRAVYRSRLLLDQDHATRSASLAKIYQDAGLEDVALREAARAVSYDYASHSAHQFLAESYNALRDPTRFNLRYETVWFNELLLANILSPVGAGLLSQNISQQEYASLFEHNRLGLTTSTEYRSDGQFREIASHYGLVDRLSYTLDLDYQRNEGTRPNNDLNRIEWYSQFKYQLTDRDSVFLLTKYQDYESGDNFQHYDPAWASRRLRVVEKQKPIVLTAWHREWAPGSHTTVLGGLLQSEAATRGEAVVLDVITNIPGPGVFDLQTGRLATNFSATDFTAYSTELNQVWQGERTTTVVGLRALAGNVGSRNTLDGGASTNVANYYGLPVPTLLEESFWRTGIYGYETFAPWSALRLTAGLAYEHIDYPTGLRTVPLSGGRRIRDALLPKAAVQWDIHPRATARGFYAQGLGGSSYEESVRLEPTQLAGFPQTFRGLVSEAEAGSLVVPRYEVAGAALDVKLNPVAFLGLQANWLFSETRQPLGAFRSTGGLAPPAQASASSVREILDHEERTLGVKLHHLLGAYWSAGLGYEFSFAEIKWNYPELPAGHALNPSRDESAWLGHLHGHLNFQHPSGFFLRGDVHAYTQDNRGYGTSVYSSARPDDSVTQVDILAGWRFLRRRGEVTFGCLNATDANYRLSSLTPLRDMPRERVWTGRLRLSF